MVLVAINWSRVERSLRSAAGSIAWFRVDLDVTDLESVASAANQAAAAVGEELDILSPELWFVDAPEVTGSIVGIELGDEATPAVRWLHTFAGRLQDAGRTGSIDVMPSAKEPRWIDEIPRPLMCYMAVTLDAEAIAQDPVRNAHWHATPSATQRLVRAGTRWARLSSPEAVLRLRGFTMKIPTQAAEDLVLASLAHHGRVILTQAERKGRHLRRFGLSPNGGAVFVDRSDTMSWHEELDSLLKVATAAPEHVEQAFVRRGFPFDMSWSGLQPHELPGTDESDFRYYQHLLCDYVPDAHGVQVLRTAHLDRARDLSGWEITDLGHGRHLLKHPDVASWYADEVPPADLLARARHDFGGMILTREVVASSTPSRNTPPWEIMRDQHPGE